MQETANAPLKARYSRREFCELAGIGKSRFYELLNAGELTAQKDGRSTFITAEAARAYIASRPAWQPSAKAA